METIRSALGVDYPRLSVIVIDDGSTDSTLARLTTAFKLAPTEQSYHPVLPTRPVLGFYSNPQIPNLLVVQKKGGGKPDALNTGINLCHTPYFCCLDADCILERDALLRLVDPILKSPQETIVSGGNVRIINGCTERNGRIVKVGLPRGHLERFQVVEYLRSFLTGRNGWALLGGTVIVSGALALFQHKAVMEVGGFSTDTVTEDMDLVITLRRWAANAQRDINMSFTSDPVCWTECPATLTMLNRQRRRWQLGLCQTLRKHSTMLFRSRYGTVGLFSLPFHLYVECLGSVVEFLGYLLVPFSFLNNLISPILLLLFILLGLAYGGLLSVGAILLEEMTYRRYPQAPRPPGLARVRHGGERRLPPTGSSFSTARDVEIPSRIPPLGKGHAPRRIAFFGQGGFRAGFLSGKHGKSRLIMATVPLRPQTSRGWRDASPFLLAGVLLLRTIFGLHAQVPRSPHDPDVPAGESASQPPPTPDSQTGSLPAATARRISASLEQSADSSLRRGDFPAAIRAYLRALEIEPESSRAEAGAGFAPFV